MSGVSGVSHLPVLAPLTGYILNNLQDGEPLYVGKVAPSGAWLIQKFATGTDMLYANRSSNPTYDTYLAAWVARVGLVYGRFDELKDY